MTDLLIGYQKYVDWMGDRVLTLADLWPDQVKAMIVGVNPAPPSVAAGHYYQGRTGQRQLRRLSEAGLFSLPAIGTFFEVDALAAGVGFTDLVKRPTVGENGVTAAEMQHGRVGLARDLSERRVMRVICVFRHPAVALLGNSDGSGWQEHRTSWGARVFRMPVPYDPASVAAEVLRTLLPG